MVDNNFGVRSPFSVVFTLSGANLSGSLTGGSILNSSQTSPLSGSLNGTEIAFQAVAFLGDPEIVQTFSGSVASNRITGTWTFPVSTVAGPGNTGTFELDRDGPTPPLIASLDPSSRVAGGPAFLLTVNGTNFTRYTVVQWNGADRSTTWISSSQVMASIQSQDIADAGTAQITVRDNQVNEQTSTASPFQISVFGLNVSGSMPHIATAENWTTTFTLINNSPFAAQVRLSLFGDSGSPLPVQFSFPQQPSAPGPMLSSSLDRTIAPNASLVINGSGPTSAPVQVGSAHLAATGTIDGFAIFHQTVSSQEAVVPLETRNASSYLLAFDNTNGLTLGVAVENVSSQNAVIPVVIRDDTGAVISAPGAAIFLAGNGHTSFVLSSLFPVTADELGTIEFDTPAGGQIGVLGLRFTPPNNALTTIPALANVGTSGGSIAHLASGGDGWQTTFVLVNTGTSATQATLSFFADTTGAPLSLPLSFPQSGGGTTTVASSVTRTMAAGATLMIVSSGALQLLTGSAQLITTGHVSGFVIFRHSGQEAVVPLESRNSSAYILAFDNTNGTATGVAVNAVSAQQVNIPVTVRDDMGSTIATDTIALAANGHYAFTLGSDRYSATARIRGTIEFDTPASSHIGALGIRIRTSTAQTFTTLPVLAK